MPFLPTAGNTMERVRDDLLRRARSERQQRDMEQGSPQQQESGMTEQYQYRPGPTVPRLFGEIPREEEARGVSMLPPQELESPKSPDYRNNARGSTSTRWPMPNISRIWSRGPPREQDQDATHPDIESQLPLPDGEIPLPPEPVTHSRSTVRAVSSHYPETDRSETTDSQPSRRETDEERRRRRRRRHRQERGRDGRRKRRGKPPQRFLYCFPWVKSKRMRAYILRCFVSGLFLVILLTVYLALSVSNQISMGEFTIVLILIVILATLFFCYGLIKLCMLVMRRDRARQQHAASPQDGDGFAIPEEPIQVTLARDEEAAGIDSETSKITPPAYGVWRESVRVDPDRIFWQRNGNASTDDVRPDTRASRRPPSYISDDGVSYVVDAAPRSTVSPPSSVLVPLPTHPAEVGRMNEWSGSESDWRMYR